MASNQSDQEAILGIISPKLVLEEISRSVKPIGMLLDL